jgi:hypothetical protein
MMVEYDSPSRRDTERMLTVGYPPAVTPLGFLLFQLGCRSYKNWHISEGWREGPRKLQGFKPWNEEIAREKSALLLAEVRAFLDGPRGTGPARGEGSRVPALTAPFSSPPAGATEWQETGERNGREILLALAGLEP